MENLEQRHFDMVYALAKDPALILEQLDLTKVDVMHHTLGIVTEAGELADAVKKYLIYNKPIDRANVVEELGDLEFYLAGLRQALGISRAETLDENIGKLSRRYPGFQYSDIRAELREDKK